MTCISHRTLLHPQHKDILAAQSSLGFTEYQWNNITSISLEMTLITHAFLTKFYPPARSLHNPDDFYWDPIRKPRSPFPLLDFPPRTSEFLGSTWKGFSFSVGTRNSHIPGSLLNPFPFILSFTIPEGIKPSFSPQDTKPSSIVTVFLIERQPHRKDPIHSGLN